jgi:hypothetical protein
MSGIFSIRNRFATRNRRAVRKASSRMRPTWMALEDRRLLSKSKGNAAHAANHQSKGNAAHAANHRTSQAEFLSICAFFPKKDPAAGEPGGRCLIGHPRSSTQLPASHFALTAV